MSVRFSFSKTRLCSVLLGEGRMTSKKGGDVTDAKPQAGPAGTLLRAAAGNHMS